MAAPRLNNQSPVQKELDSSKTKVGRSAFDFSHLHSGTALIGALTPVLCMEVVPNEDIDINLSALIQLRNPLTRPLLNGMRVYFHGYCNYLVDLWEGAKNFLDNGRSGRISIKRPNLRYSVTVPSSIAGAGYVTASTPLSLLTYLGLPTQSVPDSSSLPVLRWFSSYHGASESVVRNNSGAPSFFPADVCVAYQRNWRDFYSNKNLLQNNSHWFPENEDHFILPYSCSDATVLSYSDPDLTSSPNPASYNRFASIFGFSSVDRPTDVTPECNNPSTSVSFDSEDPVFYPNLSGLKFRQFRGDRFTSGSPFPDLIRGDIPVLFGTGSALSIGSTGLPDTTSPVGQYVGISRSNSTSTFNTVLYTDNSRQVLSSNTPPAGSQFTLTPRSSVFTLNDIRALETYTVFKERLARTNGDYNEMIEAQFGYNPHHHVREATYIGGFYTDFHFSTVVQQSQSTSDSPLGTKSGDATAQGQGRIGHIHTRDYGWIQVYMSIVPDVMYIHGIARQFSRQTQSEMYFPLFNNLKPQAILNKELYLTGSEATDEDVFAYEDRYAEFKSCTNRISGLMALPYDKAEFDASRIMARRFTSTPALNSQFVTMVPENVDMQVFSVVDEPPFDFQIGFDIRRVAPMPYTAIPGSMSSLMHA